MRWWSAAFAAAYDPLPGIPPAATADEMFPILPQPRSRIDGTTAWIAAVGDNLSEA